MSTGRCSICKEIKTVNRDRKTGSLVCRACYTRKRYHNSSFHKRCTRCGETRAVGKRDGEDKPICKVCCEKERKHNTSLHEKCFFCGNIKPVETRIESGPICCVCYNTQRRRYGIKTNRNKKHQDVAIMA